MKRFSIKGMIIAILAIMMMLSVVSCAPEVEPAPDVECQHIDRNKNGLCDLCEEKTEIIEGPDVHIHEYVNGFCQCGKEDPLSELDEMIKLDVLEASDILHRLAMDVGKETKDSFELINSITLNNRTYKIVWETNNDLIVIDNTAKEGYAQIVVPISRERIDYTLTYTLHTETGITFTRVYSYYVPETHFHEFVDGKCYCGESDPDYVPPTTPTISVTPVEIIIIAGERIDLMQGVSVKDDGDDAPVVSIIDDDGFDNTTSGVYIITYSVVNKFGNSATALRKITVVGTTTSLVLEVKENFLGENSWTGNTITFDKSLYVELHGNTTIEEHISGIYHNVTDSDIVLNAAGAYGGAAIIDKHGTVIEGRDGLNGKLVNKDNPIRIETTSHIKANEYAQNMVIPAGGFAVVVDSYYENRNGRRFIVYNVGHEYGNVVNIFWLETEQSLVTPEVETHNLSFIDRDNCTSVYTDKQIWKQDNITLTNNKGQSDKDIVESYNPAVFNQNSEIIIECTDITKIVFTLNSSSYAERLKNSILINKNYSVTISGSLVTVTFIEAVDIFTIDSLSAGDVYMNSLSIEALK